MVLAGSAFRAVSSLAAAALAERLPLAAGFSWAAFLAAGLRTVLVAALGAVETNFHCWPSPSTLSQIWAGAPSSSLMSTMSRALSAMTLTIFLYVGETVTSFHSWLSPSTSSQVWTQVPFAVPLAITSSTLPQALLKNLTPPSVSREVQVWASVFEGSACSTTRPLSRPVACRALPLLRFTIINSAVFLPAICETSFLFS